MQKLIAIDFETGNPKRVSACAIGYAKIEDGEITESNGHLIKPVGGHAAFQSKIHGIKSEDTIDKPDFGELFPEIEDMFSFPLVAHSLFDKQVLNALAEHFGLELDFAYLDTSAMAKQKIPDLKNHKLKTLVRHFRLPDFRHHDAREDALACANIFLRLQADASAPTRLAECASDKDQFRDLAGRILEDAKVDYKEAYELLYWLEDHREFASQHQALFVMTKRALEDDNLDQFEAEGVRCMLVDALAR